MKKIIKFGCLCCLFLFANPSFADRSCFCSAWANYNGSLPLSVKYDLTTDLKFRGALGGLSPAADSDCRNRCTAVFNENKASIAQYFCSQGVATKSSIFPNYWIGASSPKNAGGGGSLVNEPARPHKANMCPSGWLSGSTNVPGGETTNGECKKEFVVAGLNVPPPSNGTPIGSWGFWWGNSVIARGNASNGGEPHLVPTLQMDPPICVIQ